MCECVSTPALCCEGCVLAAQTTVCKTLVNIGAFLLVQILFFWDVLAACGVDVEMEGEVALGEHPASVDTARIDAYGDTRHVLIVLVMMLGALHFLQRLGCLRRDTAADGTVASDGDSLPPSTTEVAGSPRRGSHGSRTLASRDRAFKKFALRYLPPYFCGVFADWMLGPYVYEVYTHYGYSMSEIGTLYVVGFVSSLSVGTLMGPFADRYGRRRAGLTFCVIYIISCLAKNVGALPVLWAGRFFGGVGTSLLYTAFESWAVSSLDGAGLDEDQTSRLFALATFGNALSAVLAGLVTYPLNEAYGPVAPFNAAIVPLIVCGAWILHSWDENYGDQARGMTSSLSDGVSAIFRSRRVFTVGLVSAFFEAVLYIFVFIWTPSLQSRADGDTVPLGLVFSCYMTAKMCGTYAFGPLLDAVGVESALSTVLLVSALAFAAPVWRESYLDTLIAHCAFEFSVGMYWPAVSTLRSECIAEALRSTTMSLFRVPLNIFVVFCLYGIDELTDVQVYRSCSLAMVFVAVTFHLVLSVPAGRVRRAKARIARGFDASVAVPGLS